MMTPLRVLLAAVVLAGCASIPYDARDPSATIYISVSPGGFGSTPMGRRVEWTWQHRSVDNARLVGDNRICNAASKTNTATMIRGQPEGLLSRLQVHYSEPGHRSLVGRSPSTMRRPGSRNVSEGRMPQRAAGASGSTTGSVEVSDLLDTLPIDARCGGART